MFMEISWQDRFKKTKSADKSDYFANIVYMFLDEII